MLAFVFGFVVLFGILVTVHEWGHYAAARALGIQATHFSVGFGPTLWSRIDSRGCRWQVCLLPLGGYVRFLGDKNGTSAAPDGALAAATAGLPAAERRKYFHLRGPRDRAIVIFAGPGVNLIFGLVLISGLYVTVGRPNVPPVIGEVVEGRPAARAGIRAGDRVVLVNGHAAQSFTDVHDEISLYPGEPVRIVVEREADGAQVRLPFTVVSESKTVEALGATQTVGQIGIKSGAAVLERLDPVSAVAWGGKDIYRITKSTFVAIGQIVTGRRPLDDIGGPVRIAEASGHAVQAGLAFFVFFLAAMNVNLAVVNLLPIPVLDGAALVVCAIEGVIRRPLSPRALGYAQNAGAFALISLMAVLSVNDLLNILHRVLG